MRLKRNYFILLVSACAVTGFAVYDYVHEQNQETVKKTESLLYSGSEDQVQKLEIKTDKAILLEKGPEGWHLKAPLEDQGDQNMIAQFISGIVTEKALAEIAIQPGVDRSVYGLLPPKGEIILTNNLGESQKFSISNKKNFEGNLYLEKGNSKSIFVVSSTWSQKIERKVDDFRDRRWARVEPAGIMEIGIKAGDRQFVLVQKDENWISKDHPEWKLDQNKVRNIVSAFSNNQFQKMDIKLETQPLVLVNLKLKDGKSWSSQVGINKNKRSVLTVDGSSLSGEIITDEANELYRFDLDAVRDRNEPFVVKKELIKKVTFESPDARFIVLEKDNHWILGPGDWADKRVNEEAIHSLIGKIPALNVKQFIDLKGAKLESTRISVLSLLGEADKVLFSLKWSESTDKVKKPEIKVQSSLTSYLFTLDLEKLKELGLNEVLKVQQSEKK
jgi:hypothetical protein